MSDLEPTKDRDKTDRGSMSAFGIGVAALLLPVGAFFFSLSGVRGGMELSAVVAYTLLIPYILSNRYLNYVPWELLKNGRKKLLLLHASAAAGVFAITAVAFAFKSRMPEWFTQQGRKGSLFEYVLGGIILALAFWECSQINKQKPQTLADGGISASNSALKSATCDHGE